MFNTQQELLDGLLGSSIASLDITDAEYQSAVSRYIRLGAYLCEYWGQSEIGGVIYPQGSMNLGTVTRIVHRNDEYDLDAVCVREFAKTSITQAGLKADVGHGLQLFCKSEPTDDPELDDEGKRCWTLMYPGQPFHLDVLPSLPDPDNRPNGIILTDRTVKKWQHSNPLDYAAWFRRVMAEEFVERRAAFAKRMDLKDVPDWKVKTTLQRSTQALKRHRDIHFSDCLDDRPPSIVLTTLAARAYRGRGSLYEVLRDITTRLPEMVDYRHGIPVVVNPIQPLENFAERWATDPRKAELFFDWAAVAAADFGGLGTDLGVDRIITKVAAAFGERPAAFASKEYGMGMFKASNSGRLGMAAGTGTLMTGAGRPVRRHSFRGDTNR
jgi:hypothetical protein